MKKREEDNRAIRTEVENRLKNLAYGFSSITPVLKVSSLRAFYSPA